GVVFLTPEEMHAEMLEMFDKCTEMANDTFHSNISGDPCPVIWDKVMCWPQTSAGTVASQKCPPYINMFKTYEWVTRECLPNGTWHDPRPERASDVGFTNYTACIGDVPSRDISVNISDPSHKVIALMTKYQGALRTMYNVGFGVSLVALLMALFVMSYFRKLRCPRNYIHLNLFVAFILRACTNIIRENTFVHNLGFEKDVVELPNGMVIFTEGLHWECRLFYTIYNYVLMASYAWVFVEALYIHMVIFIAVFTEKTKVVWYIVFGWTFPVPFVLAWAIARIYVNNQYCWNYNSKRLILITQVPIYIMIVVNFFFFINIVRLLLTKMNSVQQLNTNRYRTLAKSLVVLIVLFGVHFIIATLQADDIDPEGTVSFILLIIEMFFNSYQGLFIAVLLCFTNSEVRSEVKKSWSRINMRRSSAVSRTSFMNTRRSFSIATKTSEVSNMNSAHKRYMIGRKSSVTDIEQTVPFKNTLIGPCCSIECEAMDTDMGMASDSNLTSGEKSNGHLDFKPDEFELKINVVNIECTTRDGLSRNTTALNIQALKNGCTISSEKILNNNVKEPSHCSEMFDPSFNVDKNETQ
ncbi:hypothetical protein DPMN_063499, partial [Dreissena polymorpha]